MIPPQFDIFTAPSAYALDEVNQCLKEIQLQQPNNVLWYCLELGLEYLWCTGHYQEQINDEILALKELQQSLQLSCSASNRRQESARYTCDAINNYLLDDRIKQSRPHLNDLLSNLQNVHDVNPANTPTAITRESVAHTHRNLLLFPPVAIAQLVQIAVPVDEDASERTPLMSTVTRSYTYP